MDIAATDSSVVYGNEDIVRRLDLGLRSLFESDVVRFVENEGEVLHKLNLAIIGSSGGLEGQVTLSVLAIVYLQWDFEGERKIDELEKSPFSYLNKGISLGKANH